MDARIGRPFVLTPEEETLIVNWVINIAKEGFPPTKDILISSVFCPVQDLGETFTDSVPGGIDCICRTISESVSLALTTLHLQVRGWFCEV